MDRGVLAIVHPTKVVNTAPSESPVGSMHLSLSDAARAAEFARDATAATRYHRDLVAMAGDSGDTLAPVQRAKRDLDGRWYMRQRRTYPFIRSL